MNGNNPSHRGFLATEQAYLVVAFGAPIAKREPATIAFATSASEAALPRAMESMEALGVPRRVVSFVIPTGYSFNLDGSTLYLAVASVFVAQAGGMHLSVGQQVLCVESLPENFSVETETNTQYIRKYSRQVSVYTWNIVYENQLLGIRCGR